VMDYSPINLAPKGVKQGDYFTTTLGPYDYLAIEYAYRPLAGGTEVSTTPCGPSPKRLPRQVSTTPPMKTCPAVIPR